MTGTSAAAAPFEGTGKASATEWKKGGTTAKARARALRRARLSALDQALKAIEGPVDRAARKAVVRRGDGFTGAYRILDEQVQGDSVSVRVEVDIDTARLAKRLTPRAPSSSAPLFRLGGVDASKACGSAGDDVAEVLGSLGVVAGDAKATPLRVSVRCRAVGAVPNTFLRAATVDVDVRAGKSSLLKVSTRGFAVADDVAIVQALGRALDDVAAELLDHRRGQVVIRVEAPLPAARVRRLQRAMRESVVGVRGASVAGLDPDGAVRLSVEGSISAAALARKLEALSLPGFSLTIVGIDGPDALTIRLH